MNIHNYLYLKDQLRNLGVDNKIDKELREKMETPQSFSIMYGKEFGADAAFPILKFKKSTESDLFFLNMYTAHLVAQGVGPRFQTFRVRGMEGVRLYQAYNLLSGRAVLTKPTDGQHQDKDTWLKLDFTKKDVHGNFKIKEYPHDPERYIAATSKLGIFPMPAPGVMRFHAELQAGNLQAGFFQKEGTEVRLFIQYDPAAKEVIVHDKQMKRLNADEMKSIIWPEKLKEYDLMPKKKVRGNKKGLSI